MKITTLQIQKFPEKWMATVWLDSLPDTSIAGVGMCRSDSIENLKESLRDFRLEVDADIEQALGGLK